MPSKKKKKTAKQKYTRPSPPVVSAEAEATSREGTPVSPCLIAGQAEEAAPSWPTFLHDPGNGLRVRNVKNFLQSPCAQPVAEEEEIRVFGADAVWEMLMTLLPEDTALILWYNKSRKKSRICPSCLRLYNTGDDLAPLIKDCDRVGHRAVLPQQLREQELSGFCSPECFYIAAFDFPGYATDAAWGHTEEEMGNENWKALNDTVFVAQDARAVLGMVVQMTRIYDLGLPKALEALEAMDDSYGDGCN